MNRKSHFSPPPFSGTLATDRLAPRAPDQGRVYLVLGVLLVVAFGDDKGVHIGDAKQDRHGFLVHEVRSPYQAGTTQIRVLLPDNLDKGKLYPVIFVLPSRRVLRIVLATA